MPLTPQITLTFTLFDFEDDALGSASSPAYVQIALANFGPFLPVIAGTGNIAKVGPVKIPYTGTPIEVELWGNDVITPAGTYYVISIIDDSGNILQSGAYVFDGTVNADFSTISPTFPSYSYTIIGNSVIVPFAPSLNLSTNILPGDITFDITLTGNVTSFVLLAPLAGQHVTFIIEQDATGGREWTWPSNVENPGVVDTAPNAVTVQTYIVRANGNLYPLGPQTWN